MDPLSITANTTALIALVQRATNGVQILVRTKEASVDLLHINNELADFHIPIGEVECLCRLTPQMNSPRISNRVAPRNSLDRVKPVVLELEEIIAYKLTKPSSKKKLSVKTYHLAQRGAEISGNPGQAPGREAGHCGCHRNRPNVGYRELRETTLTDQAMVCYGSYSLRRARSKCSRHCFTPKAT